MQLKANRNPVRRSVFLLAMLVSVLLHSVLIFTGALPFVLGWFPKSGQPVQTSKPRDVERVEVTRMEWEANRQFNKPMRPAIHNVQEKRKPRTQKKQTVHPASATGEQPNPSIPSEIHLQPKEDPEANTGLTKFGPRRFRLEPSLEPGLLQEEMPGTSGPALSEAEQVKKNLDEYLIDVNARRRAQSGNVDPSWIHLLDRIEQCWNPTFSQVQDRRFSSPSLDWLASNIWNRMQNSPPSAGGISGDPFDSIKSPTTELFFPAPSLGMVAPGLPADPQMDPLAANAVIAVLEIRFGEDSKTQIPPQIVTSSGYLQYDKNALSSVKQALEKISKEELPPAPSRGLISLSSQFEIHSVLPLAGMGTELLLPLLDPVIPAQKKVLKRVGLVAVYPPKLEPTLETMESSPFAE